jgi:PiT family inorganic phosphate transporter
MAWNIGANDIANSMGSAVGAEAITLKQAIFIGSILCFAGATLVGSHVTDTIRKGIINTDCITNVDVLIKGLLATLTAASLWVTFATWRAWPVSTTHSIVGALTGFGLFAGGYNTIEWNKLIQVVISWVSSPLLAGLLGFVLFRIIRRYILMADDSRKACLKITPVFVGLTILIVTLSILLKTPFGKNLGLSIKQIITLTLSISLVSIFIGRLLISIALKNKETNAESIFRVLQVGTSCYVAFSIGANDVANAIGPVAGIISIIKNQSISSTVPVPMYLLALGGIGITVGIATWGYRVIATIGRKITELTNTRGFAIDFSAATSVLLASKLGMPVSTTHAVIGAVCGVGIARGLDAVDFRIVKTIFISWIVTLPAAAISAILFFKLFNYIF